VKKTASKKKTEAKTKKSPENLAPIPTLAYILPGTLYAFKTDANSDSFVTIKIDKSEAHRLDGIQRRVQESFVGVLFEPVNPHEVDNMVSKSAWGGLEGA
jgi:hypothetical protein